MQRSLLNIRIPLSLLPVFLYVYNEYRDVRLSIEKYRESDGRYYALVSSDRNIFFFFHRKRTYISRLPDFEANVDIRAKNYIEFDIKHPFVGHFVRPFHLGNYPYPILKKEETLYIP